MNGSERKPSNAKSLMTWAWIIWLVVSAIMVVRTARNHEHRTVTTVYYEAAKRLSDGLNPYESGGYHYPPHFSALYVPFQGLGRPAGDIAWRLLNIGCLGFAVWAMSRRVSPNDQGPVFFWTTVLSIPLCMSAMRNGQANTIFGALMMLSALALSRDFLMRGAAAIGVAACVKHLAVPMMLLACISHPRMIVRMLAVGAVWIAIPFIWMGPESALEQYRLFLGHATSLASGANELARVTEHRFADINGIIRSLGHELPRVWYIGLAMVSALGLAIYWLARSRRVREPMRSLLLLAFSVCYLMLFNPMTESNSYAIAAPVIALLAVSPDIETRSRRLQILLICSLVVISVMPEILRPVLPMAQLWLKPLAALLWFGAAVVLCEREAVRRPGDENLDDNAAIA